MRRGLTGRMVVASGLLALIVGAAFAALLLTITNLRATTDLRRQAREELVATDRLEKLIIDLETGLRGFVITREERFLEPWNSARAALPETAAALERLAADQPTQLARVRRIVNAAGTYVRQYTLPLVAAVRRDDASAHSIETTDAGKRRVDALRASFRRFREGVRASLSAREADADEAARRATAAAAVGVAGSILLILIFTGYLARVIVQPLRRAALMADRLAGGDLSARMREGGVAEIEALERSFNVMAGSLERNRAELAGLLAEQEALRRVATLVAQAVSPQEVFETVIREVGVLSGADLARMERYEPDGSVTGVAAWSRVGERPAVGARFTLEGLSVAALVRRTSHPVRVDSFSEASGPIAEEARQLGIRSSVGCPIVVGGRLWGVIAASSRGEAPFPAGAESQIAEFTELVATAIANAENRAELAASRARVVAASDETRRRIERDLHDGTQQRLVSLMLELRATETDVPPELDELRAELSRTANGLAAAVEDLQEISRGIHPAILSRGGLAPALETLADRTAIPVTLDARIDRRMPESVEVAAYYVVSEALTNAAKHAQASSVQVELSAEDSVVRLAVRDDGVGGADPGGGSGLVGLRDRVEALGGTIEVASRPDLGTTLLARIPIAQKDTAD